MPAVSAFSADLPNLTLYQPQGWSGKTIISTELNAIVDSSITASDSLYLSWAVGNLGSASFTNDFYISVSLDGQTIISGRVPPIDNSQFRPYNNYSIGKLCVGEHTIRIDIDGVNLIEESNESDNSYTRTISVTRAGTEVGEIQLCPPGNEFGNIAVSNQDRHTFLVTNSGCGFLDISGMSISGSERDLYSIASDGCSGRTLLSANGINSYSSTCTIEVSFAPDSSGTKNASLNIQSSDADSPNFQIPLSGEGVLGDFDGGGSVSIDDVISVLQLASSSISNLNLDSEADINGDGRIGLEDAIYVMSGIAQRNSSPVYEIVRIQTDFGDIMIWLHEQTPLHRKNFLSLVKQGFYDGLLFHRVIDGFMIQGGDPLGTGSGGPGYTIPAEINSSLTHIYGAVAAARLGDDSNPQKNSSGSQFYIVENPTGTPHLDMNYTVFGQVISCMGVVEAIAAVPKNSSDKPLQDVVMTKVEVVLLTARQLLDQYGFTVPVL